MADDARPVPEASVPEDDAWAYVDYDADREAALDAQAIADFDVGRFISHEAMKRWVRSLGTADPLPPPRVGD